MVPMTFESDNKPPRKASLSRREFIQAAGGLTFLALVPIGNGLFAATPDAVSGAADLPVFIALPYIQPGPSSLLADGNESIVVAWKTDSTPADFVVTYGPEHGSQTAADVTSVRRGAGGDEIDAVVDHAATLTGLKLGTRYAYTVSAGGQTIAKGVFTTRKAPGSSIRFVAFGDNSYGEIGQRAIAYYAYQTRPDFVMNTGDNVYDSGLDNEYARYFFPIYNAEFAHPTIGAPLLRSVPFYTVMANHDVHGKDENGHPAANFDKMPDALGYYTNMHLPLNGPATPVYSTPIVGSGDRLDAFRKAAGNRYPGMANYSFDYGDAHFLCLDANVYIDPTNIPLQQWIAEDLSLTKAIWKFVVYHHPAFNVGHEHYQEQHMRVLSPLLEQHGVDFVLNGHEHVYQRTRPFRFQPNGPGAATAVGEADRLVPGTFVIDTAFDGASNTRPSGIIYITTGAGGKHLYDPGFDDAPDKWLHQEDGNAPYNAKFYSKHHSFTVFEIDGHTLKMRQIDEFGREVDSIQIDKQA